MPGIETMVEPYQCPCGARTSQLLTYIETGERVTQGGQVISFPVTICEHRWECAAGHSGERPLPVWGHGE